MNSTDLNLTLEEYLLAVRGPKHLPNNIVIPITIVYVLIFVTGVFGNVAVCLVIVRNASMRTATNYYLFSLSVSDLTLLILGLPYDLGVFWQQYPWSLGLLMCKLRALVSEMSSYTSVLTIVAFSMERYLAICHPLHAYAMSNLERAVKIIAFLWLLSLASATPFAVFTTISYVDYPPGSGQEVMESAFCAMMEQDIPEHWPIYEISSFLFFMLPMCVILVLYVLMGMKIRNRKDQSLCNRLSSVHSDQRASDSRTRSIIRMLASVVVAFFLCWAPFHAQRLIYLYGKDAPNYTEINEWMYYITGILYYFSSTVNPILYSVMSARYRAAFRKTICQWCCFGGTAGASEDDTTSVYRAHNGLRYNGSVMSRGRSVLGRGSSVHDGVRRPVSAPPPSRDEALRLIDRRGEEARRTVCFDDKATSDVVVVMGPASNGKAKTMTAASLNCDEAPVKTSSAEDLDKNRETHI